MSITLENFLWLAVLLFIIGACGMVMHRQNFLGVIIALETMMAACFIAFVATANYLADVNGHIFAMVIVAVGAAEVGVGLAILIVYSRLCEDISLERASQMKG